MSLSSELARPDSAVRGFLEANFPEMDGLRERWNKVIGGIEPVTPNRPGRPPYSTIGTAFDYRLRFAFDAGSDIGELLATIPAQILSLLASDDGPFIAGPKGPFVLRPTLEILNERPPDLDLDLKLFAAIRGIRLPDIGVGVLLPEYFSMLTDDLARLAPSAKRLQPEDEDLLDRHCYVLGLLDELFRGGYHIRSPLYDTPPKTPPHDLLELGVPWSQDLAALYQLFWEKHRSLFDLAAITNPHFAGSAAIGGADADLIVDHQLIEVKTTIKPTLGQDWVWQLIGYLLLDWDDTYEISGLGVYSSRHGVLTTWPLNEFLRHASSRKPRSVASLRDEFRKIVIKSKRH